MKDNRSLAIWYEPFPPYGDGDYREDDRVPSLCDGGVAFYIDGLSCGGGDREQGNFMREYNTNDFPAVFVGYREGSLVEVTCRLPMCRHAVALAHEVLAAVFDVERRTAYRHADEDASDEVWESAYREFEKWCADTYQRIPVEGFEVNWPFADPAAPHQHE